MNDYIEVIAIVEGKTEQIFIEKILRSYLAERKIYISATQISKPGQKGGDVRFERLKNELGIHLKSRSETYVTTMVDYYGVKEWPGLDQIPVNSTPSQIAEIVNIATKDKVISLFPKAQHRFIPYMAIHEFEALLFSDSFLLASGLKVAEEQVLAVLREFEKPEAINNSPETAPSKRLNGWSQNGKFLKTTNGIAIAESIGIPKMRAQCPVFNAWIEVFEKIVGIK